MRTLAVLTVTAAWVGACASSSTPAAAPAQPAESGSSSQASPGSDPKTASTQSGLESQREPFMQSCMAKAHSADYCACGFTQFVEIFQDADLSKPLGEVDPRLKTLHDNIVANCASKLDEATVKRNFGEACVSGNEKKVPYCDCAWSGLRKNLALTDFMDAETPRFVEAKKAMVGACKGTLPAEVAMKEFMTGCIADHPERQKGCTCFWKKLRAKYSAEEIEAGALDVQSVPGLDECRK